MARIPGFALVGVLLLAAACGAERGEDSPVVLGTALAAPSATGTASSAEPTSEPSARATVVASPTPTSISEPPDHVAPTVLPLETRFPSTTALIEEAPVRVGVAVLGPDAAQYVGGDDGTFALASVVKVPIMLATLERARIEARELSTQESSLLDLMMTISSNSATDELWRSLSEGPGVADLLQPFGIEAIEYAPDDQWGDSRASALQIAMLLDLLISTDSELPPALQAQALELMQSVVLDQRWGASAGVDYSTDSGVTLAIKNGWYPEPSGWLLNSAGVITVTGPAESTATHVVVVLTEGAPTRAEGVRVIEEIAATINHEFVAPALAVALAPPTFPASTLPGEDEPIESDAGRPAEDSAEAVATSEPAQSPPMVALVGSVISSDVLVPASASLVGSEATNAQLRLWYELPTAEAEELLQSYAAAMTPLGWLEIAGPPSIVLSKTSDERWVGVTAYPVVAGARLIEVTISPAPGVVPAGLGTP